VRIHQRRSGEKPGIVGRETGAKKKDKRSLRDAWTGALTSRKKSGASPESSPQETGGCGDHSVKFRLHISKCGAEKELKVEWELVLPYENLRSSYKTPLVRRRRQFA